MDVINWLENRILLKIFLKESHKLHNNFLENRIIFWKVNRKIGLKKK